MFFIQNQVPKLKSEQLPLVNEDKFSDDKLSHLDDQNCTRAHVSTHQESNHDKRNPALDQIKKFSEFCSEL